MLETVKKFKIAKYCKYPPVTKKRHFFYSPFTRWQASPRASLLAGTRPSGRVHSLGSISQSESTRWEASPRASLLAGKHRPGRVYSLRSISLGESTRWEASPRESLLAGKHRPGRVYSLGSVSRGESGFIGAIQGSRSKHRLPAKLSPKSDRRSWQDGSQPVLVDAVPAFFLEGG